MISISEIASRKSQMVHALHSTKIQSISLELVNMSANDIANSQSKITST